MRLVTHRRGTTLAVLAAGAYVTSFFLPTANHVLVGNPIQCGGDAFLFCLRSIFEGETNYGQALAFVGWLANPMAWIAGILLLIGNKHIVWPALVAFEMALCPLPVFWDLVRGHTGYWTWLASLALLLGANMTSQFAATDPTKHSESRS